MRTEPPKRPKLRPVVLGTGLVALDVVLNGDVSTPQRYAAGGTCGNVLINLAFLGWDSYPVARLKHDWASEHIKRDMSEWGVKHDFLHLAPLADTPIIIHRIRRPSNGTVSHSFSWKCPHCRRRLPPYRAVTKNALEDARLTAIEPSVFIFDRPSPGALKMARKAREDSALVVFELAGRGTAQSLQQAFEVAHMAKYSDERDQEIPEFVPSTPFIEVKTHGAEGLSFRCNLRHCRQKGWMKVSPYVMPEVKDAAGAGDWCTAGLINKLGHSGLAGLSELRRGTLLEAFQHSQALAAINCAFEGARGSMYVLTPHALEEAAEHLVAHEAFQLSQVQRADHRSIEPSPCPVCGVATSTSVDSNAQGFRGLVP